MKEKCLDMFIETSAKTSYNVNNVIYININNQAF